MCAHEQAAKPIFAFVHKQGEDLEHLYILVNVTAENITEAFKRNFGKITSWKDVFGACDGGDVGCSLHLNCSECMK